jgi:hypothetical protein
MLLPALRRSREVAKQTACKNNLRQLGISIVSYTSDHNGWLPNSFNYSVDWREPQRWWGALLVDGNYVEGGFMGNNSWPVSDIFDCMSTQGSYNNRLSNYYTDYVMNLHIGGVVESGGTCNTEKQMHKIFSIKNTNCMLLTDIDESDIAPITAGPVGQTHNLESNVLWIGNNVSDVPDSLENLEKGKWDYNISQHENVKYWAADGVDVRN